MDINSHNMTYLWKGMILAQIDKDPDSKLAKEMFNKRKAILETIAKNIN